MASFKEAFAAARKEKGAGKTFTWQGKSYTTDLASEKKAPGETRPKARPKPPGAERPKARPSNTGPSVMSEAPKQGKAPKAEPSVTTVAAKKPVAQRADASPPNKNPKLAPTRKAAGTPFAPSRSNPKVSPLGKSTGIGGRAAEAVKSFLGGFKVNAGKNKTVAKAPNRSDVTRKK